VRFAVGLRQPNGGAGASNGLVTQGSGPFLYDPFSAKREQARALWLAVCLPICLLLHARRCIAALQGLHHSW
jgi:hypothetical protein